MKITEKKTYVIEFTADQLHCLYETIIQSNYCHKNLLIELQKELEEFTIGGAENYINESDQIMANKKAMLRDLVMSVGAPR